MNANLNGAAGKPSPWWREPMVWLIVALPVSAIIGGAITIWFAVDNADTLVSESHYKQGLGVHLGNEQDKMAVALAVSADLEIRDEILHIRLAGQLPRPSRDLVLSLARVDGGAGSEKVLIIPSRGGDLYQTPLPALEVGKRALTLESNDHAWRLRGVWMAPFSGSLRLSAGATAESLPRP
jgi:uncharacterized protein